MASLAGLLAVAALAAFPREVIAGAQVPFPGQPSGGDSNSLEPNVNTATSASAVYAAQATAASSTKNTSPYVCGRAFDRYITIWLENTDYSKAAADPNLQWLASKGITLNNYFGVTHPSEPNYVASVGGDNFGMDNVSQT